MNVTIDFETMSATDLKKAGAWRYAECPSTGIINLGYSVEGGPRRIWHPGDDATFIRALAADPDTNFIAHNVSFEKAIWRRHLVPAGWPDIPNERWRDTMAICAYKALPLGLDDALKTLRLPRKDMEGSETTIGLSKTNKAGWLDHSPENIARADEYVASDVRVEEALHERLGDLPEGEMQAWLLDQTMNERGLLLDRDFIVAAIQVVEDAKRPLLKEFEALTGLKPTQREKVLDWLKERGCELPNYAQEAIEAALGLVQVETSDEVEDDRQVQDDEQDENVSERGVKKVLTSECRRVLEIRQITNSSSVKKLDRMILCMCEDDRVRGHTQYHGTGPGRPSGRLFQPLNFPRGSISLKDPDAMVELIKTRDQDLISMLGPPIEVVVSSLRHAVIASPGKVFISGDYAGIQARVVLALAGEHEKCRMIAAGADVYCDMAGRVYKRTITKKNKDERQLGKGIVLGAGFGMGAERFVGHCFEQMGLVVSPELAEESIRLYRKEWAPGVLKLWRALAHASTKAVWDGTTQEAYGITYKLEDGWLSCRLPSGRKIWYWNPVKSREAMPWDADDIRPGWYYHVMAKGAMRPSKVFGGLLTENCVMGIERDIMMHAKIRLEAEGFPIALEVYDEALVECDAENVDTKLFRDCMLDMPQWVKQIQIPVDVPEDDIWVGRRYRK